MSLVQVVAASGPAKASCHSNCVANSSLCDISHHLALCLAVNLVEEGIATITGRTAQKRHQPALCVVTIFFTVWTLK